MRKSAALIVIILVVSFAASSVLAQRDVAFDPYQNILKYPETVQPAQVEKRDRNVILARLLEQPFRPVGFILGETAEWVERHHVEDKAVWFFDELASHGIYPRIKSPTEGGFGVFGPAGRIQLDKLLKLEQPFLTSNVFGGWTPKSGYDGTAVEIGGDYKIETPTIPVYQKTVARYTRSSAESFYGVGQDTSVGDSTTYQPEEFWLEGILGYHVSELFEMTSSVAYQHYNIGNGNREGSAKIKEYFPAFSVPGINGADLIGIRNIFSHDTRDYPKDPKKGGIQKFEFSYFHDTDGSNFQYLKFAGSAAHFFPVFGSDRRILALRISSEKNQELQNDQIPFFNMARLGGSDLSDGSELMRAWRYNRFFEEGMIVANAEYRYNIYEYGNFASDAFALFDVGEVFEEIGDFGFDELKLSYGGGLNIKYRRKTFLSFIVARGSEGLRAVTHTKISF